LGSQLLRRSLGLGFLLLAGWVLIPSFWVISSIQAVVNAPVVGVHASIEGTVTPVAMDVGQAVRAGQALLRIDNELVDQGPMERLKTEEVALSDRIEVLRRHHHALGQLKEELIASTKAYQAALVSRLEQELSAARLAAASAEAVSRLRGYEKGQLGRLVSRNSASELEDITARYSAEAAVHGAGQAKSVAGRLDVELGAAREGVYVGSGGGLTDVPYSGQRLHEVMIRQAGLEADIQEMSVRRTAVIRDLSYEKRRVERLLSQTVQAPSDGVVWRRHVTTGTRVGGPAPVLLHLVNPDEIFIDALVAERYAGFIHVGDRVRVKFIGLNEEAEAVVKQIMGRSGSWDDELLATEVLTAGKRDVHIILTIDKPGRQLALEEYRLGHPVEVIFGNQWEFLRYLVSRPLH